MQNSATSFLIVAILTLLWPAAALHAAAVRFITLNDEIAASKLSVRDSKTTTVLKDLSSQKRSMSYPCTLGKKPLLLVALDRKDAEGKPATVEIVLPPAMKSPLVVILPDPQHPTGLRVIALDDSRTGFPWGSLRLFNASAISLMIHYGSEEKALTDSGLPVDIIPGGEARNVGVQLFKEKEPTEILYSAVWEHEPNVRKLIFIVPAVDTKTKAIELKIIPEDQRVKK